MTVIVADVDQLRAIVAEAVSEAMREHSTPAPEGYLDRAQAAQVLGVSLGTLDRLRARGLPEHRVGDSPRFLRAEIIGWESP